MTYRRSAFERLLQTTKDDIKNMNNKHIGHIKEEMERMFHELDAFHDAGKKCSKIVDLEEQEANLTKWIAKLDVHWSMMEDNEQNHSNTNKRARVNRDHQPKTTTMVETKKTNTQEQPPKQDKDSEMPHPMNITRLHQGAIGEVVAIRRGFCFIDVPGLRLGRNLFFRFGNLIKWEESDKLQIGRKVIVHSHYPENAKHGPGTTSITIPF